MRNMNKMPYHKLSHNKERKIVYSASLKPSFVAEIMQHTDNFSKFVEEACQEKLDRIEKEMRGNEEGN